MDALTWIAVACTVIAGVTTGLGTMDPALAEGKAVAPALALTALAKSADASATVNRTLLKGLAMIESTACYWFVVSMVLIFTNPLWYAAPAAAAQAGAAPADRGHRMTAAAGLSAPTVTLQDPLENAFAVFHQRRRIFQPQPVPREVATVASVSTGTARVQGLPGAGFGELLLFLAGLSGIPFNLDEGGIDVALLSDPPFARGSGRAARRPRDERGGGRGPAGSWHQSTRPAAGRPGRRGNHRPLADRATGCADHGPRPVDAVAADRPEGDRRGDSHRSRPARADPQRPANQQHRDCHRHHLQPARKPGAVRLLRCRAARVRFCQSGGQVA